MLKNILQLSLLYILLTPLGVSASGLGDIWKQQHADQYKPYKPQQLKDAEDLFSQLLNNNINNKIRKSLSQMNLKLSETDGFLIITEARPPFTGQGMYVIRKSPAKSIFLQAPHSFYDLRTGSIARKLMNENNIKALALNTTHRKYADMAHSSDSLFMVFSHAFINTFEQGEIIQLHGFNPDNRWQSRSSDFILSNGTVSGYQKLDRQAICIRRSLRLNTSVYPRDISVLGGTRNSIGRMIRAAGSGRFSHIEISSASRQLLNRSAKKRKDFSHCILK